MIKGRKWRRKREMKSVEFKRNGGKSPKKSWREPTENKSRLPKNTNYLAFNSSQDHICAVIDKSLFRKPNVIKSDRSCRDIRKNCAYKKNIGHNTEKCNILKDEIERLIRARHFRVFLENKRRVTNTNERPRQRSPKRIREVLMICGEPHIARESRGAWDRYAKEARSPLRTQWKALNKSLKTLSSLKRKPDGYIIFKMRH